MDTAGPATAVCSAYRTLGVIGSLPLRLTWETAQVQKCSSYNKGKGCFRIHKQGSLARQGEDNNQCVTCENSRSSKDKDSGLARDVRRLKAILPSARV